MLLQNNIPSCSKQASGLNDDGFSWYSDEENSENEQKVLERIPAWQTVRHKRKRLTRQKPAEREEQINTTNRYESLSICEKDTTGNVIKASPDKKEKKRA
jgi:hypothetical protein